MIDESIDHGKLFFVCFNGPNAKMAAGLKAKFNLNKRY